MYKKIYRSMCFLSVVTLVLAVAMTLAACYTSFNNKFKNEIKRECIVLAKILENTEGAAPALKMAEGGFGDKRITLISPSGKVIYDSKENDGSFDDHTGRPEIIDAIKNGTGEAERYSETSSKKLYYYAVRLTDNYILRIATAAADAMPMFYSVLVSMLFISALIYILTAVVATRLTDNIVKPIEDIRSFDDETLDNVYEEIQPFLKRIARQNLEISHRTSEAKSQSARIRAIMDNINEGLLIIDKNSDVLSVNDCALEIFDTSEASVKHKSFKCLTDNEQIRSAIKNALLGTKDNLIFEAKGKTYQVFYSPVYEKGEISGAVMLLFDVSQKTQTEKIRREFTANVSHELKTPLTTIHGYAQIIDSGIAKPDDISGFVKKIEKESSRLITLVNDIIELSHLDETSENPEMQHVSLKPVVSEVVETLGENAGKKNVTVIVEGEDTTVYANISQLTEMIYNLTDNAIKYNKNGGSVIITIGDKFVKVTDTGIGIPQKYYDRIFERFFRVDKSHSKMVNGTGLGLSIVKHLAKANNAEISVASELGKGTEFTIKFNG